jgi:hypothetical protein
MIRALLLTVLMYAPSAFAASTASGPDSKTASTASPFPLQLEARVPFAPTAFPSAAHTYAVYELHLTNFSGSPIRLQRIDVLDAERPAATPLASYAEERLNALLQSVDTPSAGVTEIRSGATVIAFIGSLSMAVFAYLHACSTVL